MPRLRNLSSICIALSCSAIAGLATLSPVQAEPVKIGMLSCHVAPGVGAVILSSRQLSCRFAPDDGRPESYVGSIDRFGVDLGFTGDGVLLWAVFAPTYGPNHGALSGSYVGGGATATVGIGVGANALFGGFDRSVALQPVSFQGQTGLDVNAGATALSLHLVRDVVRAAY